MSDRTALYRSIIAEPEDDTPRLVYADWLEENGRAEEAEFIRLECRLENCIPQDPDLCRLQERRGDLQSWLSTHVKEPDHKFPSGLKVDSGEYPWEQTRRGFPRFLEFEGNNRFGLRPIRALAAVLTKAFAALPTRWLVVRFISVEQLAELLKHPVIAALDRLTIQLGVSEEPRDEVCRHIADCKHLRNLQGLSLGFAPGIAGAEALARSTVLGRLRWFSVEPTALSAAAIRALAASDWFPMLCELSLNGNCPGEVFEELSGQKPFPSLHSLNLIDNDFPTTVWQAFAESRSFPALGDLDLTRTDMSGERFAALAASRWFRPSGLDLNACAIGEDGAEALTRTSWVESLTRLNLRNNRLSSRATATVARCPHFIQMKQLALGNNTIGARTLRALTTNPALRGITRLWLDCREGESRALSTSHFERFLAEIELPCLNCLNLSGLPVGSKAVRLLASEKYCSLTRLGLNGCKLTDSATGALITAHALQYLIELDLGRNNLRTGISPLTDRGTMPMLAKCYLKGNPIPPELARKLRRRPALFL